MYNQLVRELNRYKNLGRAKVMQRFFKTGKGEYGEGDVFLGLSVPRQRLLARKYMDLTLADIQKLLKSRVHEYRFTALVILVTKFSKSSESEKRKIYIFYLKNAKRINNWDLVDTSAPYIVGEYLRNKDPKILYKLAQSNNLWKKRIAMLSTFAFIKRNQFQDAFNVAKLLINDEHDLIHKSVGWMLREVGNRNLLEEKKFLKKHYKKMARAALRYAIEKFPKQEQKKYLNGRI
jgi:3-methyladenine DNA glycosylase AlkD